MSANAAPRSFNRGDAVAFAGRTEKNLDYVLAAFERQEDVHVVTHIVMSLLGLLVFPYELAKQSGIGMKCIEQSRLDDLVLVSVGQSKTLKQLVHRLRNGVAHRQLHFSHQR